jgi:hypothetical protein
MGDVIQFPVARTRPPAKPKRKRATRSERVVRTPKRTIILVEKDHD